MEELTRTPGAQAGHLAMILSSQANRASPAPRLTIPRLIRHTLKFDRALLGKLHHVAHSTITT